MVYVEPAFPRCRDNDGKQVSQSNFPRRSRFGASTVQEAKPNRLRPKDRQRALLDGIEQEEEEHELNFQAYNLCHRTIRLGMLVLGYVRKVSKTELLVGLPGRLLGIVPISAISNAYSQRLEKMMRSSSCDCPVLQDLYQVGDLVYVKVVSTGPSIGLSLKPADLHSEFVVSNLVPGLVLAAAIAAQEDHGFLMETGIRHVRAFLPLKNLRNNATDIGRNLFCSVEKVTQLDGQGATLILKAFGAGEQRMLQIDVANLDALVPGCIIPFTVGPPVEEGLRGTLFDDTVSAFVNRNMLTTTTSKPEDYTLFKQLDATLLYVFPLTKKVFVSLTPYKKNRLNYPTNQYLPGSIATSAQVVEVTPEGVWFEFDKHRALMPRNIIKKGLKSNCNYDDEMRLGKYQEGTIHTVKIIRYDLLDRSFVVCDSMENADDELLYASQVLLGETYKCKLKTMDDEGSLSVQLGQLSGLVPKYFQDRKTNVKAGSVVPMVAAAVERNCVILTNRAEFTQTNAKILSDWDQVNLTSEEPLTFDGVVVKEDRTSFDVQFFNNIFGKLHKNAKAQDTAKLNMLQCGTIARFTVHKIDEKTKTLVLRLPVKPESRSIETLTGTVTTILPGEVEIEFENSERHTIPLENFSLFKEHNALHVKLLQKGDSLQVVTLKSGICSFRDVRYFEYKPYSVRQVQVGDTLRATCYKSKGKVYANLLLIDYKKPVKISLIHGEESEDIPKGKIMMVRVNAIMKTPYVAPDCQLVVSSALKDVCPRGIENVYSYMLDYLEDVINLIGKYKKNGMSFANYSIGEQVVCTIVTMAENSEEMVVEVHEGSNVKSSCKGIAFKAKQSQEISSASYNVGDRLDGRVVWVDVESQLLYICIDPVLLRCIVEMEQEFSTKLSKLKGPSQCSVLFQNNYVRICCLAQESQHPLVLVPSRHHYNELQSYAIKNTRNEIEVIVDKRIGPMLFGMTVKSFNRYNSYGAGCVQREANTKKKESNCSSNGSVPNRQGVTKCVNAMSNQRVSKDDPLDADAEKDVEPVPSKKVKNVTKKKNKKKTILSNANQLNKKSKQKENVSVAGKIAPHQQPSLIEKKNKVKAKNKESIAKNIDRLSGDSKQNLAAVSVEDSKKLASKKLLKNGKRKLDTISVDDGATPLKKKKKKIPAPFVIDQLDGCDNDFLLEQLDGAEGKLPSKRRGPPKRPLKSTPKKALPGTSNFWDSKPVYKRAQVDSSEEDEDTDEDGQMRGASKKRLTAKERFEAMKQEEERLRKIEEVLADPSAVPHTPDQFDRMVLAQPNNSMLWIRYMVFHMESAELDKARAVARKALKAINFREEEELLNVWVALLNLEIRYETVESYKEVLQEAIQYNDQFKLYSRVLDILIDCQKHTEVRQLVELLQKKFRKQNDMWCLVADAWYRIGQGNKAKPLLSQALKSLPTRDHIPLIVKFAFLHNRNGNRDEAHLLFEQILTSYPKRTDIWSQYVDMLVKDGLVTNARQILERAIVQRLPMKNMKTLYTKYVNFEEKHGNRDSVRRVKQMASDYVQGQLNNAGITSAADNNARNK